MSLLGNPVLLLVIELIILGFAAWLVESAPFIDASFKGFIKWILMALAAVLVVVFLLGLVGITL